MPSTQRTPRQAVLIMTDTQRKDMLGCYGNQTLATPALDALAEQGIRFERAYTCQPVCGPARAALFTGMFPHSAGSWANSMPLGANVRTIGQRLRDAGVATGYVGKWHLDGSDYFGLGACPDGWEAAYWYDMRCYLEELTPEERRLSRLPETNRHGIDATFTYGYRCSERAIRFLEDHRDDDFLLALSYDEPHHPFLCPEPYASMYRDVPLPKSPAFFDDLADKPGHHRAWSNGFYLRSHAEKQAFPLQAPDFLGCNSFVDSEIGRVIGAIDRCTPGALLIYTSDHGDLLGAHGMWGKGPATYEEITNIPLLVRWPGHASGDAVCDHPVSHIDIAPTLLEFFGAPLPPLLEGRSLLPCFEDPALRLNDAVFIEYSRYEVDHDGFGGFQPLRCVFDGRYKLTVNLLDRDELYDLDEDPYELANLIDSPAHHAARDMLHDRLIDWMGRTRDPFRGYQWQRRPWRADAPAATWDYTGMTRQREEDPRYEPRQLDYATGIEMVDAVRKK